MILTIQLPPDLEAGLLALAHAEGLDVPHYVENLVRGQITARANISHPASELSSQERLRHLNVWLSSHAGNTIVLPNEAMERESIYGNHGS